MNADRRPGPRGAVAVAAGVFLAVVTVDFVAATLLPGSALRWQTLPPEGRLMAFAWGVVCSALAVGMLTLPPVCAARLRRRVTFAPGPRTWRFALALYAWPFLFLYVVSWLTFRATGRFLGVDGLAMWASNALQFTQHVAQMEPVALVVVPPLSGAVALLFGFHFAPCVAAAGARGLAPFLVVPAALVAVAAIAGAAIGERTVARSDHAVQSEEFGTMDIVRDAYASARDDRAGPAAEVAAEVRATFFPPPDEPQRSPRIRVERRPLVAMDDWVASIDRTKVRPYNVIVLLVEALRRDALRGFGGTRDVMPTLDQIASEGRRYLWAYAQSSHSDYADICPVSSHYPLRAARIYRFPRNPPYPRVPIYDALKALGWRTAVFSSQNENWGQMLNYLDTGTLDRLLHSETFDGPTYVPRTDAAFTAWIKGSKRAGKIDDRFTVDEAIKWIGEVPDRPFFIYMNLQTSHVPYEVPADYARRWSPPTLGFTIRFGNFPRDKVEVVRGVYFDALGYIDAQLSRLVGYLRATGRWDQTVIAIGGDNGEAFYEHGFAAHASQLYNEVMHVPLVMSGPGIEPGTDDRPAQAIDVPPTIFDALGIPAHPSFQGISLLGDEPDPHRPVFLVAQNPLAYQYAVVRDRMKLIHDRWTGSDRLYDLVADPSETRDLSGARPQTVGELREWLDTWRSVQIDHYRDPNHFLRGYPPVLAP